MSYSRIEQVENLIVASVLAFCLIGCSKESFLYTPDPSNSAQSVTPGATPSATPIPTTAPSPAPNSTPIPTPYPTTNATPTPCVPVANITRLTKILFLVDTSGSNNEWVNSSGDAVCTSKRNNGCIPPTDPEKNFRLGSIRKFVNTYGSMSNLQWGLITFSNESTRDYIGSLSAPSFTSSTAQMNAALDTFSHEIDYADTPYGLALENASSAVSKDPDRNSEADPQYYVIMLSDGYPTDLKTIQAAATRVGQLLKAAPREVTLSSIFYGDQTLPASFSAMSLLDSMAHIGGGQFANVNNPASGIDIETVLPGHNCPN